MKFKNTLIFLPFIILFFLACNKEALVDNSGEELFEFPENTEEVIDGEIHIDGISQAENIMEFDLPNVEVIDGRLAFANIDDMMDAIQLLGDINEETHNAWAKEIGFHSLFSEYSTLKELPIEEVHTAISNDLSSIYFEIWEEENTVDFKIHIGISSLLADKNGLIQVGDYVGINVPGLNAWTTPENVTTLIAAIKNKELSKKNNSGLLVVDTSILEEKKNWTFNENCPKNTSTWWQNERRVYNNPSSNRRLHVQHYIHPNTVPTGTNAQGETIYDYYPFYGHTSWSYKNNRQYKTDHYLTINLNARHNQYGGIFNSQKFEIDNSTKIGHVSIQFGRIYDITLQEAHNANHYLLMETIPSTTGSSTLGTGASHKGMGGRWARQDCD